MRNKAGGKETMLSKQNQKESIIHRQTEIQEAKCHHPLDLVKRCPKLQEPSTETTPSNCHRS